MTAPALCGAKTRQGGTCRNVAGYKTDHVGYGHCAFHNGATPTGRIGAARDAAAAETAKLGVSIDMDPLDAIAQCVAIVAGRVAWFQGRVAGVEPDEAIAAGELHPMLRGLDDSIDRLTRTSKVALDAGLDRHREMKAEAVGELLAEILAGVIEDLGLAGGAMQDRLHLSLSRRMAALEMRQTVRSLGGGDWELPDDLVA